MSLQSVLSSFAWPLAAVVLGLVFLVLFKSPISRFIDRTKSISKGGVRAYDEAQLSAGKPEALAEFLETYHNPLLLEVEAALAEEIHNLGLTDPTDVQKALYKGFATNFILRWFEAAQNTIFASQVSALTFLNSQPKPTTKDVLKTRFYDRAVSDYPLWHADRSFDQWYAFLIHQNFVAEENALVGISVAGRQFLQWRVTQGHSGPMFG